MSILLPTVFLSSLGTFGDVPTNVQVSRPSDKNQAGTVIRVNPLDRNNLAGGSNDNRVDGGTAWTCAFYATRDGGEHWRQLLYPSLSGQASDPAVAFGPNGEVYYGACEYGSFSAIYVGESLDGGFTVNQWNKAVGTAKFTELDPFLVCDTSPGSPLVGNLYLCWTRAGVGILVRCSTDGGQSWSAAVRVNDSGDCSGSVASVGPNGELYVAFLDHLRDEILVDRSLDGGLTWGTDVEIGFTNDHLENVPFHHIAYPTLDVDTSGGPHHGAVYVAYSRFFAGQGASNVRLYRSTDQGQTFGPAVRVDDDRNHTSQFQPSLDVDPNGNVVLSFYDRREDPNDSRIGRWVARSTDGGQTFQNVKASDRSFDPFAYDDSPYGANYFGHRSGVAASDRSIHPLWTDGRNFTNDIYSARVQLDFCGDTDRISAATGGQVNFTVSPGPLHGGATYWVLGSYTGTKPGLDFGSGVELPLNYDLLFHLTLTQANGPVFQKFRGLLDANGNAAATLDTQGSLSPLLVGLHVDFATLVLSGGTATWASNPFGVDITP